MHSYKLASREICPEGRTVSVGDAVIGGKRLAMMAGPCAVESEEQIMEAAAGVKKAGAQFLRGGAYKPRTSPYAFQGMEDEGFKMLRQAADATGLKVVSEVIAEDQMDTAACLLYTSGLDKIGSGLDRQAAGPFLFFIAEQTGFQNHL